MKLFEATRKNFLKNHHIRHDAILFSHVPHTHWIVIRTLGEKFASLIVEPVNSGPIVG